MSFNFNSQICHGEKEYKIQITTDNYEQFLYIQEKARECIDGEHKECNHEWELINIYRNHFSTTNEYRCSKCGAERAKSMGI